MTAEQMTALAILTANKVSVLTALAILTAKHYD